MRPRVVMSVCLAIVAVVGSVLLLVPTTRAQLAAFGTHSRAAANPGQSPSPRAKTAAQPAPPPPELRAPADPNAVTSGTSTTTFFSWAFLDLTNKTITGSANSATGTNSTESMVKAWIASDYLRDNPNPSPSVLNDLHLMIINSNDDIAQEYYVKDGTNAVMQRMIKMCGLTNTAIYPYWWSRTQMSPRDAVRYGDCVADGTAAGPKWTSWILTQMREVQGSVADNSPSNVKVQGGRWGIIDGLPANLVPTTSIKNGWTYYGPGWHVNCLAINPGHWVLNVMMQTDTNSLQTAANVCAGVARQLTYTPEI
ncbi:serine hydrolase [Rugosimonospora acidiphila]|uniref:Serine hydrolase n=1 Tax=Rugosimonospora acidiphila TaxID=556531 RepID=A0ABP9RGP0_9ACTN